MEKVMVKATRNFTVGPNRETVIKKDEIRVVGIKNNTFWTHTTEGNLFGMCTLGDGWELLTQELPNDWKRAEYLANKPNQKQFKQFDESLFKTYIDKFSDEDRYKMIKVLGESFGLNFEFHNSFTSIWNKSLNK